MYKRQVLQNLKITEANDTVKELDPHRINKDQKCLENIIDKINKNVNPFDERIDNNSLFNIVTGRDASCLLYTSRCV